MPTTIKLKNSVTTTNVPSSLAQGEVAINVTDKKVWVGNAATTPVQLLGTGADGSLSTLTVGAGTVSLPSITTTGDTNTGIFFPAADTIAFSEGGAEAMRIDSSGNLGIGTNSPSSYAKLAVRGYVTTGSYNYSGLFSDAVNSSLYIGHNAATATLLSDAAIAFATGSPASLTERMRIDSSGNVGIGTSSPTTRLSVVSATNAGISVNDGTVNTIIYNSTGGVASIGTTTNHPVDFYANNSSRMRLDTSGNLGIGTSSPSAKLSIAGSTASDYTTGMTFSKSGGNTYAIAPDANDLFVRSVTGGTEVCRFTYGGNLLVGTTTNTASARLNVIPSGTLGINTKVVTNGDLGCNFQNASANQVGYIQVNASSTTYSTASDYRLKENIAPMTGALAKVAQLKPVTYTWKSTGEADEGFIAHELQEVCPSAVSGEKDAVDSEGNIKAQGIDTSFLVATLTAAIQEMKQIIDAQAERITALENK